MLLNKTSQEIRPLDTAFNLLHYMHITWPVHNHYFCNETCLSILLNKKIEKYVILTSALPEYIEKRFKKDIISRSQEKNLHTFKILFNNLEITILSVDEYPWLEMYKEKYIHFNSELLFMDWESQVIDPYGVEKELLENKQLKILYNDELIDIKAQEQIYKNILK